jgi:uncharacterized protein (DUF433 family)
MLYIVTIYYETATHTRTEGGMEIEEIVKEYELQKEDVLAALAYAARVIAGEEIIAYAQA